MGGKKGRPMSGPGLSDVIPRRLTQVGWAPLPYDTHPIDMYHGPQGWGPFQVPWQPIDFIDPNGGIDITWAKGDNAARVSPPYGIETLFEDFSLERAANSSLFGTIRAALGNAQRGTGSTIANSPTVSSTSQRIKAALGLGVGT